MDADWVGQLVALSVTPLPSSSSVASYFILSNFLSYGRVNYSPMKILHYKWGIISGNKLYQMHQNQSSFCHSELQYARKLPKQNPPQCICVRETYSHATNSGIIKRKTC